MRNLSRIKNVILVSLLAVLLTFCFSMSAYAASAVTFTEGRVFVDKNGSVGVTVCDDEDKREDFITVNGKALLHSGRIHDGECVDVKITRDRGQHRGHVTVLK